ncbi:MAG: T9SS type B sorting domain-containing protein, partial [Flavobacteriaceae bacterium]|nr:T9SS type B sorting domain-containing protein [Flavobacteriaceae bacterium]
FDGFTTSLTAQATLIPGATYELKMVIADRGDSSFDSAVFFRAGSFDIGSVDLGIDLTVANGTARCEGKPFEITPGLTVPPGTTYEWQFESPIGSGIWLPFIPAELGPTLTVSTTGNYKLIVDFAGVCESEGVIFVEFDLPFTINMMPNPLVHCDFDGFSEFDLTLADLDITGGDPNLTVTYHSTFLDAENGILPLVGLYPNDDIYNDSVWARVESIINSCYETVELSLEVRDIPAATTPAEPLRLCDDAVADGFTFFDLTVVEPEVLGGLSASEYDFYYYVLESDAVIAGDLALTAPDFSQSILNPTNFLNTNNPQVIYILLVGNTTSTTPPNPNGSSGCYDIVPLTLIVDPLPPYLGPFEMFLCDDEASGSTVDETSIFDLTIQDDVVTGSDPNLTVTWYATVGDELADIPIPDPTAYSNTVTPETVIGRITSEFDCSIVITLTLTVLPNPVPNFAPDPLELCDDNDDGLVGGFDLTLRDVEISGAEVDVTVLYYEDLAIAKAGFPGTEIMGLYTNTTPFSQIVYARVTRVVPPAILPCYTIVELELKVIALPDMPDSNFINPMVSCDANGNGQAIFDLTQNDLPVIGVQDMADFLPITYYTSELDVGVPVNEINPANAFVSGGQIIWVRLESTVTGCVRISTFQLAVGTFPLLGAPNDLFLCDDEVDGSTSTDGLSTFDLTLNTELIQQGDFDIDVRYYKDAGDQVLDISIMNPETYQNIISPQQEIFVSGYNLEGCPAMVSFFINVDPNPNAIVATPLVACDDNGDGIYSFFDLTTKNTEISNGETDVVVSYYETEVAAGIGNPNTALQSPYTNIDPFVQTIYARVTRNVLGALQCHTVVSLELRVEEMPLGPDSTFIDPLRMCDDDNDGFVSFDLTVNNLAVYAGQTQSEFEPISYYETELDANDGINAIPDPTDYVNIQTPDQPLWVRLERTDTGCARVTEFALRVDALPLIGVGPFEMLLCDDEQSGSSTDTFSIFDLTQNNDDITLMDPSLSVIYYATADDQTNDVPILDPTAYQNETNPQDIFVTVYSKLSPECSVETNVILRVLPNPLAIVPLDYHLCDDVENRDGRVEFDLSTKDVEIIGGQPDVGILYYDSMAAAIAGALGTELPTLYTNDVPNEQTIYARVTNMVPPAERGCYDVVALVLIVDPLPDDGAEISDEIACQDPFVGIETIILKDKDLEALNGQSGDDFKVYYFEDLEDAEMMNISMAISSGTPYPYNTNERTIYVGIENKETHCYIYYIEGVNNLSFVLDVKEGANATPPLDPYTICDNYEESDGIGQFTLISDPLNPTDLDAQADALVLEILNGQNPLFFELSFHETVESAEAGTDAVGNIYINIINPQIIYVRVTNIVDPFDEDSCFAVTSLTLNVDQLPNSVLEEEYRLCVDSSGNPIPQEEGELSPPLIDTGLDPSLYTFLWTFNGEILPNEIGPSIVALQGGEYTVTVTDLERGCEATFTTTVIVSSPPETYDVQVTGAFASSHTIEATATGEGTYIFQLDDGAFQDSGTFTGVEPGSHTVTITDANGCGSVTIELGVIDYPRFMTPNQDGFHDTWNIIGIANGDPSAKIYIFDKFGKLLKQISPLGIGWDGTYIGNPLPSSDYWFRVEYKENDTQKEFRGHFTLKR